MLKKLILVFCFIPFLLSAQKYTGDSTHFILLKDTIFLEMGIYKTPILTHYLAKGQTLFSLAKFYGLKYKELEHYNKKLKKSSPHPGDPILIPIDPSYIVNKVPIKNSIPVFYQVKPKETLYTISKVYFEIGLDTLLTINNKKENVLALNERLLLGYIPSSGLIRVEKELKGSPLLQMSFKYKKNYLRGINSFKEIRNTGSANKLKNDNTNDLVVLHNKASINSIIGIYNPINKRIIYAKVIGRIPNSSNYHNSILVVNKHVAQLLGVKDDKFFIKVKYLKNK